LGGAGKNACPTVDTCPLFRSKSKKGTSKAYLWLQILLNPDFRPLSWTVSILDIFVHQQKCNALKNIDNLALTGFNMSNS
jgi:hypothetical protein